MSETGTPLPEAYVPEFIKAVRWVIRYVHQETDMVRKAPGALVLVFGLGIFLTYLVLSSLHSERFAAFEERNKYLSDRIVDYEKAFPGKSPDEAAREVVTLRKSLEDTQKHLDTLEKAVSLAEEERKKEISDIRQNLQDAQRHPFVPWKLSAVQKTSLGKILDEEANSKFVIPFRCLIGSSQSQSFTEDLVDVFRGHGWQSSGSCLRGMNADLIGLYLSIPYDSFNEGGCPVSENAARLLNMFTRAKIELKIGYDEKSIRCGEFWLGVANPSY